LLEFEIAVSRLVVNFSSLHHCSKTSVWNNLKQLKEIGLLEYGDVKNKGIAVKLTKIALFISPFLEMKK